MRNFLLQVKDLKVYFDTDEGLIKAVDGVSFNVEKNSVVAYFIPRIYNNDRLSSGQIEFIKKKANVIKERYLNEFNIESFKSENEEVSVDELNESVIDQAKRNGVWLNTADGSGIVFAIKFYDGTFGIVTNKEGKQLKLNFDDDSFLLPHTNVIMTMEKEKTIEEETGGA